MGRGSPGRWGGTGSPGRWGRSGRRRLGTPHGSSPPRSRGRRPGWQQPSLKSRNGAFSARVRPPPMRPPAPTPQASVQPWRAPAGRGQSFRGLAGSPVTAHMQTAPAPNRRPTSGLSGKCLPLSRHQSWGQSSSCGKPPFCPWLLAALRESPARENHRGGATPPRDCQLSVNSYLLPPGSLPPQPAVAPVTPSHTDTLSTLGSRLPNCSVFPVSVGSGASDWQVGLTYRSSNPAHHH